jgi:hypothetical protein
MNEQLKNSGLLAQDLSRNLKIHDTILSFLEDNIDVLILIQRNSPEEIVKQKLIVWLKEGEDEDFIKISTPRIQ